MFLVLVDFCGGYAPRFPEVKVGSSGHGISPLELLTCKSAIIFRPAIISCQQNPPVASKSSSHFYGGACHMQTAGFHYGRMRARSHMHRHCYVFYGNMWEAFGPSAASS